MPDSQVPQAITPLLGDYLELIQCEAPGLVLGFYLHGSIALGAFNERMSDIDFLTLVNRSCSDSDLASLKQIHQELAQKYPQWGLEGIYLQQHDVGRLDEELSPYPYYADGSFHRSGHHGANLVMWWMLRMHGLTIFGPEMPPITVDWDNLVTMTRENLNTYWASYTKNPIRIAWLLTDDGIQWVVLGVLRQYYTFEESSITSKSGAGEYALTRLPVRWHRIIQEALNLREHGVASQFNNRFERAINAWKFVKYIIARCNGPLFDF